MAVPVLMCWLVGCGGVDKDAASAHIIVSASTSNLELCAADAGACTAGNVRALSTVDFCQAASILVRHGEPMPEGGPPCPGAPK